MRTAKPIGRLFAFVWRIAAKRFGPACTDQHPDADRVLDCEFELEGAFNEVAERALAIGWSHDEVEAALLSLARNRAPDRIERERTGRLIEDDAAIIG